ncbi:olfactory receptor 5L1-like [Bombina bombina]|uniref:olfactory receptor 5L1-like n=1 Tax=Bombina bombina TaxID=8345 RepID=UPI00235A8462|nr:olfactory receptor 5L1-like [Bombina bombina]
MCLSNQSTVTFFIIKGISDAPEQQVLIFHLVLLIYLTTLGGNMMILLLVYLDPQLHTPMYFFVANLSVLDISYTSLTLHKILISFISGDNTVSFLGCMTQTYIFGSLIADQLQILALMSYDRYMAICNPLRYHTIMNHRRCSLLATACWMLGFLEIMPHIVLLSRFSFSSNELNHFLCDIVPLLRLTCSDTTVFEQMVFFTILFHVLFSFLLICIPYIFIINTILKIRSSNGRHKAFYTCSAHLTVVTLLYITLICQYLKPNSGGSGESDKVFTLFNTAAVPALNPIIYSLKHKDIQSALRRRLMLYQRK